MSELVPPDEVQLARERLQRSRENLQQAFAGDGSGNGSSGRSQLVQGMLLKGVQMVAGRGGPLSAVGPLISLATLLMPLLLRRRTQAGTASILAPLAIAALTWLRKR
jgi:hypothetical protein